MKKCDSKLSRWIFSLISTLCDIVLCRFRILFFIWWLFPAISMLKFVQLHFPHSLASWYVQLDANIEFHSYEWVKWMMSNFVWNLINYCQIFFGICRCRNINKNYIKKNSLDFSSTRGLKIKLYYDENSTSIVLSCSIFIIFYAMK